MEEVRVISIPRSGGTWVRNLMLASGFNFWMTHRYKMPEFVIARDIRDSIISYSLAQDEPLQTRAEVDRFLSGVHGDYIIKCTQDVHGYLRINPDLPILRYEEFRDNPMMIFEFLESKYGHVTENPEEIIERFNTENMKKIQAKQKDFSEWDGDTMIHGRHLNGGDIGRWKTWFDSPDVRDYFSGRLQHLNL